LTSLVHIAVVKGIVKKVYSYSRVSSVQQIDGFGLSRQKGNADSYAAKFGYQLVELVDDGVSGFNNVTVLTFFTCGIFGMARGSGRIQNINTKH